MFPRHTPCDAVFPRSFFGGFGGRGQQEEEEVRKGHTIYVDFPVTLKDLYVGKEAQVSGPGGGRGNKVLVTREGWERGGGGRRWKDKEPCI